MTKKTIFCTMLISLTIIFGFISGIVNVSAHSPTYIDLKYYDQDEVLSVYITHGVSDFDYHYVDTVVIEFFELPESLIEHFTSDEHILVARDKADQEAEVKKFGMYAIEQADVFDEHPLYTLNGSVQFVYNYTSQETHQVFHHNYTLVAPEWTLIVVTALCNLEGLYTQTLISGHPWYDIEHAITEAIPPTIILSIIVMTPLALWRIFGKKKEEVTH